MLSWQAMLLNGFFRFTMKRHGKKPLNLERLRAMGKNPPRSALAVPSGYSVTSLCEQGLEFDVADLSRPASARPAVIVLYLHGGGYLFGSPKTHRQVLIAMAKAFQAPAYGLDYRLAPEHPFPAALEDALAAWHALSAETPPSSIAVAGDSAGGGLALALLVALRDAGEPLPAAAVLFSPWTDLAATGNSLIDNDAADPLFFGSWVAPMARHYLGATPGTTPLASPVYADLTGLPTLLIQVGDSEVLLDDSRRVAENARRSGVDVTLENWPGVPHAWQVFAPILPEGRAALSGAGAFIRSKLAPLSSKRCDRTGAE
jgi:acetyl esterase/lipase